jgi:anti-sigma regulatory factor (Ser/Thr protein kinase)
MTRGLQLRLPPTVDAPALARRAVDRFAEGLPYVVRDDLRLLVSEVVTNSVRHARMNGDEVVHLQLTDLGERVRVDVVDPGEGFDAPADPVPDGIGGGFGLYLVRRTAERWGVVRNGLTRVWFELAIS